MFRKINNLKGLKNFCLNFFLIFFDCATTLDQKLNTSRNKKFIQESIFLSFSSYSFLKK